MVYCVILPAYANKIPIPVNASVPDFTKKFGIKSSSRSNKASTYLFEQMLDRIQRDISVRRSSAIPFFSLDLLYCVYLLENESNISLIYKLFFHPFRRVVCNAVVLSNYILTMPSSVPYPYRASFLRR